MFIRKFIYFEQFYEILILMKIYVYVNRNGLYVE